MADQKPDFYKEINLLVDRQEPKANYRTLPQLEFKKPTHKAELNINGETCEHHPFCNRQLLINNDFPRPRAAYLIKNKVGVRV